MCVFVRDGHFAPYAGKLQWEYSCLLEAEWTSACVRRNAKHDTAWSHYWLLIRCCQIAILNYAQAGSRTSLHASTRFLQRTSQAWHYCWLIANICLQPGARTLQSSLARCRYLPDGAVKSCASAFKKARHLCPHACGCRIHFNHCAHLDFNVSWLRSAA